MKFNVASPKHRKADARTERPRSLLRRCKVVPSAKRITEQRLQSCMPYMWAALNFYDCIDFQRTGTHILPKP